MQKTGYVIFLIVFLTLVATTGMAQTVGKLCVYSSSTNLSFLAQLPTIYKKSRYIWIEPWIFDFSMSHVLINHITNSSRFFGIQQTIWIQFYYKWFNSRMFIDTVINYRPFLQNGYKMWKGSSLFILWTFHAFIDHVTNSECYLRNEQNIRRESW